MPEENSLVALLPYNRYRTVMVNSHDVLEILDLKKIGLLNANSF